MNTTKHDNDLFPSATAVAQSIDNEFSYQLFRKMAIQDIREMLIEDITLEQQYIEYTFSEKMREKDIMEIKEMLEDKGYILMRTEAAPSPVTTYRISLPE